MATTTDSNGRRRKSPPRSPSPPTSLLLAVAVLLSMSLTATGFVPCLTGGGYAMDVVAGQVRVVRLLSRTRDVRLGDFGRRCRPGGRLRMDAGGGKKQKGAYKVIATNKKAFRNYEIVEKFEAGIELVGSEVKSCRMARISMDDGYAQVKNGECRLHGVHIAECTNTNRFDQHEPKRPRRLLLHKRQIKKLHDQIGQKGMTVVPLKLFFNNNNYLKVEIGLAQGKNVRDKREDIKTRELKRDLNRMFKEAS